VAGRRSGRAVQCRRGAAVTGRKPPDDDEGRPAESALGQDHTSQPVKPINGTIVTGPADRVRPLAWLAIVRDHPERPGPMQCHVLTMFALRLDWSTGQGFCSEAQLMADADASGRTVRRAMLWARSRELTVRTRRGHRLGNGRVVASEWRLLSQPARSDLLSAPQALPASRGLLTSTGQRGDLNWPPEHHHLDPLHRDLDSGAHPPDPLAPPPLRDDGSKAHLRMIPGSGGGAGHQPPTGSKPDPADDPYLPLGHASGWS